MSLGKSCPDGRSPSRRRRRITQIDQSGRMEGRFCRSRLAKGDLPRLGSFLRPFILNAAGDPDPERSEGRGEMPPYARYILEVWLGCEKTKHLKERLKYAERSEGSCG
jgi:hypothetical protein